MCRGRSIEGMHCLAESENRLRCVGVFQVGIYVKNLLTILACYWNGSQHHEVRDRRSEATMVLAALEECPSRDSPIIRAERIEVLFRSGLIWVHIRRP